jgi:16S rRNA (cytosine1402-N4)-methyltransferase
MRRGQRSTAAGQHRPALLEEVVRALQPASGQVIVDCTVGWAGHAVALLKQLGPTGKLIGIELDPENLPRARERLQEVGFPFALHQGNFAALPSILAAEGIDRLDGLLADLGMSSMQVDDPERGFSYARDGPLDMRMDRSRGRTAAQLLGAISEPELAEALRTLGDEPEANRLAAVIVAARSQHPIERTSELARIILEATKPAGDRLWRPHPARKRWELHPAARTFQALRIMVNRELANLERLLQILPGLLKPRGRAAIISFHSGEDRRVKSAFRDGLRAGWYSEISTEPVRASLQEKMANPRSRSAKLRWARRAGAVSILV